MSETASTESKQSKPWLFKPGQSGNPKGRTLGARNKLQTHFLEALADDFAQHGPKSISTLREEDPGKYLQIVASLCPKELHVNQSPLDGMTDAELFAAVDALRGWLASQQDATGDAGATAQDGGAQQSPGVH